MKNIIITESQFNEILLNEGVLFNRTPNGSFDFSVNNDRNDKANNMLDTRFFRNASDILYKNGDKERPSGLFRQVDKQRMNISIYEKILDYLERNQNNPNISKSLQNDLSKIVPAKNLNDIIETINTEGIENAIQFCWKKVRDNRQKLNMANNLKTRADVNYQNFEGGYSDSDKMAQYAVGKVPETNIDVISLFSMENFNVSDILKNGNVRYGDDITKLLGWDKDAENEVNGYTEQDWNNILPKRSKYKNRKWGEMSNAERKAAIDAEIKTVIKRKIPKVQEPDRVGKEYQRLPITYDNGTTPNILNNFSLTKDFEGNDSHYRDDSGYNSVSKFIDKSILCANYALNELNYHPNFIVSAPSSSNFNLYYCTRLSQKLGVPYFKDFFKRNLINIKYDTITEQKLNAAKATEKDKEKIKNSIKNAVYAEITAQINEVVKRFVNAHYDILSTISAERYSRQKVDINLLTKVILHEVATVLTTMPKTGTNEPKDNVYRSIIRNMLEGGIFKTNDNSSYLIQTFAKLVQLKIGKKCYNNELIIPIDAIIQQNSDKIDEGFRVNTKKFKIVDIDARFRKCLGDVYIISDKYLRTYGNSLQKQYMNSNFLIFDEDIDTGATLKIVVDLLQDKIDASDEHIKCLTNGYQRGYKYE